MEPVKDEAAMREDWFACLLRPGMNVLATFLSANLNHSRSELETNAKSYDQVCEIRGEIKATRKVMQYIKKEYDRAAKGDTSEKKETA